MKPVFATYLLSDFFKPKGLTSIGLESNSKSIELGLPRQLMKYVTGAHFDEVKPAGARNLYPNPKRVGMLGRHGWRIEAVIQPFELHLVTWEQDLRDRVASFDEALDLLDELQDTLEDEPEIRSATIREVIAGVPSLTEDQQSVDLISASFFDVLHGGKAVACCRFEWVHSPYAFSRIFLESS
jgi:hypothetical protein